MPEFRRRNIRLAAGYYRGRRFYFVTICFHRRRSYGAEPRLAAWLVRLLREEAAGCGFFVHAYCVMPDHLHLLAAGADDASNLAKFVESFKQRTAVEFSRGSRGCLWQITYYDRILRESDSADRVAWYIWMNPVRKGLCHEPRDYPFLGSFTELGTRLLKGSIAGPWIPPWKDAGLKRAGGPSDR
jgi:putative transposase